MRKPPPRLDRRSVLEAGFDELRTELEISEEFAPEVLAAAREAASKPPQGVPRAGAPTIDLTRIPFVTIDPPTSRDLDQAVHIEPDGNGYLVRYAIADPTTFVAPGSPVDLEAHRRGLTMYAPDRRTPLYPPDIGEGAASLLPGVDRPSVVWQMMLDTQGELLSTEVFRATVRSREKLSYAQAQKHIDEATGWPTLALLREVGLRRQEIERSRGGVSLKLPSQEVELVDGRYHLIYDNSLPVEEWNAQVSLLAGMAAAGLMLDAGVGLLRTLPTPERQVLQQIRLAGLTLGVDWPPDVTYAQRVSSLSPDNPKHLALLNQAVRALRGADYVAFDGTVPAEATHWAISAHYSHVTAPLRRLCDRYTNEIALAICANDRPPEWAVEALSDLPETMRGARRREARLDRACVDYVEAVLLEPRAGEVFGATVTSRRGDRRSTIQIVEPAVEAMISVGLEPASRVKVRLTDAVPAKRSVHFELVDALDQTAGP